VETRKLLQLIPSSPGAEEDEHLFRTHFTSLGQTADISNSNVDSGSCQTSDIQPRNPLHGFDGETTGSKY